MMVGCAGIGKTPAVIAMALAMGRCHMSYSLNSLKGGYIGDYIWDYYRGY